MTTPEDLRAQARRARVEADELCRLAALLDRSHVHELTRLSGDRTWIGPTADALAGAVLHAREQLERAAADLRRGAVVADQDASDLERAAAHATVAVAAGPDALGLALAGSWPVLPAGMR
jgi:hypothetical protein